MTQFTPNIILKMNKYGVIQTKNVMNKFGTSLSQFLQLIKEL